MQRAGLLVGAGVLLAVVVVAAMILFRQDDLGLRQAPGVAQVEVPVRPLWASRHVIHVLDYPFVPRARYNGPIPYEKFLDNVEAVQTEQAALMRWLAARFQLRAVYIPGLNPATVPEFHATVAELLSKERIDVPALRAKLAEAKSQRTESAIKLQRNIESQLQMQRENLLQIGAVGRLLMAEELSEARPLDDPGTNTSDAREAVDRRIARNALRGTEPVVVVVLGAEHDLSEAIREHDPRCGYIRVATSKMAELLGSRR
jgi:hypothetical protein